MSIGATLLSILLLITTLLLGSCGNQAITSKQDFGIDLKHYFPQKKTIIVSNDYLQGNLFITSKDTYSINQSSDNKAIIKDYKESALFNQPEKTIVHDFTIEVDDTIALITGPYGKTILLQNKNAWTESSAKWYDAISEQKEITNTGLTITTKAGTFTDCLEITETVIEKKCYFLWLFGDKMITKEYWAPSLGKILSRLTINDHDDGVNFEVVRIQVEDTLLPQDLAIAGLRAGISTLEDAKNLLGNSPKISPFYINDGPPRPGEPPKPIGYIYEGDNLRIIAAVKAPQTIVDIRAKSASILTQKGIKIGDTTEKLLQLYGKPKLISDNSNNSIKSYRYQVTNNPTHDRLLFLVKDNQVISIINTRLP